MKTLCKNTKQDNQNNHQVRPTPLIFIGKVKMFKNNAQKDWTIVFSQDDDLKCSRTIQTLEDKTTFPKVAFFQI